MLRKRLLRCVLILIFSFACRSVDSGLSSGSPALNSMASEPISRFAPDCKQGLPRFPMGLKSNFPYIGKTPRTIWDHLPKVGKLGKNYYAGKVSCYAGMYLGKILSGVNPTAPIDDFFKDAATGQLPAFCMIDPDFQTNDDHPSHDISLGQALISSVYSALAQSPQWSRSLLVVTYDEHGGFFDHVPPPSCQDSNPEFRQLGFRVPSLVIGPTVRQGAICNDVLEHSSIAATLKSCFGMPSLSERMDATNDLASCIDPYSIGNPKLPPPSMPKVKIKLDLINSLFRGKSVEGQPELNEMVKNGKIPEAAMDPRSDEERVRSWLKSAVALGAIEVT